MPESSHTTEKDLASVRASYGSALRTQFAQRPEDREAEREHEFFRKRLRYRLRDMGVSAREIAELEKTAAAEGPELEVATLSHSRTAMLVIHGIGEQNPYETLDQFARNLTRYLKHEGELMTSP